MDLGCGFCFWFDVRFSFLGSGLGFSFGSLFGSGSGFNSITFSSGSLSEGSCFCQALVPFFFFFSGFGSSPGCLF